MYERINFENSPNERVPRARSASEAFRLWREARKRRHEHAVVASIRGLRHGGHHQECRNALMIGAYAFSKLEQVFCTLVNRLWPTFTSTGAHRPFGSVSTASASSPVLSR